MKALTKVIIASLLFTLIPIIVKYSKLDGITLSAYRVIVTTLVLLPFVPKMQRIKRNSLTLLILLGLLNLTVILLYFISIKSIGVSLSTLLLYLGNLYFAIISVPLFKEKLKKSIIIAIIFSFLGMFLIFSNWKFDNFLNIILAALSGIFLTLTLIISKILSKEVSGVQITFFQSLVASFVVFPTVFGNPLTKINDIFTVLFLSVFCTAIPFSLLYSGMKELEGQKIGITLSFRVIIPVLIGFLVFHEILDANKIIGCILVLISLLIASHQ